MQYEPISPELVLIDPELAKRERARLEEEAKLKALYDVEALRRAVAIEAPPSREPEQSRLGWREAAQFSKQRLLPAALLCSLLANGYLAAELVSRTDGDATPAAVRMVTLTESAAALTTSPASTAREVTSTRARTQAQTRRSNRTMTTAQRQAQKQKREETQKQKRKVLGTSAVVERKLFWWMEAAPARRLPARFVDRETGLVKNNVQVTCNRQTHSFLCAVRLASDERKSAMYVRYRITRKGKGLFQRVSARRG